jgi:hypothetical protein
MKSDERSRDIEVFSALSELTDPDHQKICSWLIRQIRAELRPCPLIRTGWFRPEYVKGSAAIRFTGVNQLAHAVGRKPETILAMLEKRHEKKGQGYHLELKPDAMVIRIASQSGSA